MSLHIKNMVCDRCITAVEQTLEQKGFVVQRISLGTVEVVPYPDDNQLIEISEALSVLGFELIDKEKDKLVEQIRNVIIEMIHHTDANEININYSSVLSGKLNKDYSYLSRLFSDHENKTIEKFIIQQKVEKVKELLEYGELNLNEIALELGYSSSAHLSTQFKSVTGESPSVYKSKSIPERRALDKI
jgi:AraC family transcriptional regulator